MDEWYVLNESFLFLGELVGTDFEDGPRFWDEEWA